MVGLLREQLALVAFLAALFSGVALLATILLGTSLVAAIAVTASAAAIALASIDRVASTPQRRAMRVTFAAGGVAGVIATLAYDLCRAVLSLVDASPYNPFEAVRAFGVLLTGGDDVVSFAAGTAFHTLNGTMFGIAWASAFGRRALRGTRWAIATGIGWGLFLELFQTTLYPGWLDIRAYREFVTISAAGHVVYGGTLGLIGSRLLRRWGER